MGGNSVPRAPVDLPGMSVTQSESLNEGLLFNAKWVMSWREQFTFWWDYDDDDVRFLMYQHARLDNYSVSSVKQSARRHYSVSKPTSLCSYSLIMHA